MKAHFKKYTLNFKRPGGTSRGVLHTKDTYFLSLTKEGITGIGECNLFRGLSAEDSPKYEEKLQEVCTDLEKGKEILWEDLREFPSIQFGLEQSQRSLQQNGSSVLFPSEFTRGEKGIPINGLIWMGEIPFMEEQIQEKLDQGFRCIKIKIGTFWEQEKEIIRSLRKTYPSSMLEIRVDANGAFTFAEAQEVLQFLAEQEIHSIEQPIKAGKIEEMAKLCQGSPTPIALDEELIGVFYHEDKETLIQKIQPHYIILKPSLVGGFQGSEEWIQIAEKHQIGWWITSALESNIGLNALAQWTFTLQNKMPQGLGTGSLFTNNIDSPLEVKGDQLWYNL